MLLLQQQQQLLLPPMLLLLPPPMLLRLLLVLLLLPALRFLSTIATGAMPLNPRSASTQAAVARPCEAPRVSRRRPRAARRSPVTRDRYDDDCRG